MTPPAYHGPMPCVACRSFPDSASVLFWCDDHDSPADCPTFAAFMNRVAVYLWAMAQSPGEVVTVGVAMARPDGAPYPWARAIVARRCLRRDTGAAVADLKAEWGRSVGVDRLAIVAGPGVLAEVPPQVAAGLLERAADGRNGGFFEVDADAAVARWFGAEGA